MKGPDEALLRQSLVVNARRSLNLPPNAAAGRATLKRSQLVVEAWSISATCVHFLSSAENISWRWSKVSSSQRPETCIAARPTMAPGRAMC